MDTKELQDKLFKTLDPNSGYSMEDFEKELKNMNVINNDYKIPLKYVSKSGALLEYATEGASAFDLRAFLSEPLTLKAGTVQMIPTGLHFDIEPNYELQIRPRSGLASKGIVCNFGTVDDDYVGEVKAILFNFTKEDFIINNGDRVAQGVLASKLGKKIVSLDKVDKIEKITDRNNGGFGSTGLQ